MRLFLVITLFVQNSNLHWLSDTAWAVMLDFDQNYCHFCLETIQYQLLQAKYYVGMNTKGTPKRYLCGKYVIHKRYIIQKWH